MAKTTLRPAVHDMKCAPLYFQAVKTGSKTFESRKDEHDVQPGDYICLREWADGEYTGEACVLLVKSTLRHGDLHAEGVAKGYVTIGVHPFRRPRSI